MTVLLPDMVLLQTPVLIRNALKVLYELLLEQLFLCNACVVVSQFLNPGCFGGV
jgi:hypothetical protein